MQCVPRYTSSYVITIASSGVLGVQIGNVNWGTRVDVVTRELAIRAGDHLLSVMSWPMGCMIPRARRE